MDTYTRRTSQKVGRANRFWRRLLDPCTHHFVRKQGVFAFACRQAAISRAILAFLIILAVSIGANLVVQAAAQITASSVDSLAVDADSDGIADPGDQIHYVVTVQNTGNATATNLTFQEAINDANLTLVANSIKVSPLAVNDAYSAIGNVGINVPAGSGVLSNDIAIGATISASDTASANGGVVAVAGDGSFTYTPPPGYEGSDTFSYTLNNSLGNDTATVTITVSGMIWFVNNTAGGTNAGTLQNPFTSLAAFNTANALSGGANPDNNDNIFVYESATQYSGAVALRAGQKLIGQDATAALVTIAGITVPSFSNALPAMNSANGTISNIGSTVTLNTNATVRGLSIHATTSTGMADPAAAITGASVSEVSIATTTGRAVNLSDVDASTFSFRSISANGASNGIALSNVNTTSGSFAVSGDGSTATQGGNDSGGVIQNTTGDGVSLTNAAGVTLQNMTIGDTSASAADSGDATNNIGDDGIDANNVTGLSLKNVTIARTATHGVRGVNVTNFTMNDCQNFNAGDGQEENGIYFSELRGDNFIRRSLFDAFNETGVEVVNASGTVDITFDDTTFQDNFNTVGDAGEEAILLTASGSAEIIALVTGNANTNLTKSIFDDMDREAIQAISEGASSSIHLTVENSRFLETGAGDGVIIFNPDNAGSGNVTVKNNYFTDDTLGPFAVLLKNDSSGTLDATVQGNTATNLQLLTLNHDNLGSGGSANGTSRVLIGGDATGEGNMITPGSDSYSIDVINTEMGPVAPDPDLHLTIVNNTIDGTGVGGFNAATGFRIDAQYNSRTNVDIRGNTVTGDLFVFPNSSFRLLDSAVGRIEGLTGDPSTFLSNQNPGVQGGISADDSGSTGTFSAGNADAPTATTRPSPLMAAAAAPAPVESNEAEADRSGIVVESGRISAAELDAIVAAAKTRWTVTGLSAAQMAALEAITVNVTDMPGWYLAQATGPRLAIDVDAAGNGWFIDRTPLDDSEFTGVGTKLRATRGGGAAGRVDALSTVMHELGHQLGLSDSYAGEDISNLMYGWIGPGERRLPAMHQAAGADTSTNTHEGPAFLFGAMTLGSLPAGESVTIVYDATVNNISNGLAPATVSSQLRILGDGGIDVLSDDPAAGGASDPTTTGIDSLTLGNQLWIDADGNNTFDAGTDTAVNNAALTLFLSDGVTQVTTGSTNPSGVYQFSGLLPGDYIVRVDASNFGGGQPLDGLVSISGNTDPDNNIDNDDNGVDDAAPASNGIRSLAITLDYNSEPTAGAGNDTNDTLDFGFTIPVTVCGVTAGNSYYVGATVPVLVNVSTVGTLDCITVTYVAGNHPNATPGIETGRYWTIAGTDSGNGAASGFTVDLTLPTNFTPDAGDKVCRYTGSGWDCAASSFDGPGQTVTRNGVGAFSDWAVGNNVGPNPVSLLDFEAAGGSGGLAALWAGLAALLGGLGLVLRRRVGGRLPEVRGQRIVSFCEWRRQRLPLYHHIDEEKQR